MFLSACKNVSDKRYMTCVMLPQNQRVFSFNSGGGGRAGLKYVTTNANTNENTGASVNVNSRAGNMKGGTKIVYTNANTNKNTGAKVTVNSRAPEVPSDGSEDGRSYTYVHISI